MPPKLAIVVRQKRVAELLQKKSLTTFNTQKANDKILQK